MLGDYRIRKQIGKGAFGSVYKCINTKNLRVFAIKTIYIRKMNKQQRKDVESEVNLLASLPTHKNIVKYIDTVNTDRFFCIVLEYVDLGSLQKFIKDYGSSEMSEQNVASFISQILSGLQFLHEQGIIHRDIKAVEFIECFFLCILPTMFPLHFVHQNNRGLSMMHSVKRPMC